MTATGGAGLDTYSFISGGLTGAYTITDFAVGAGGDRLDVSKLLDWSAAEGRGYEGGNPMATEQGYLRLVQEGANTLLQYDEDGAAGTQYGWHTAITLQNVTATAINAHNFKPLTIEGTDGADTLDGGLGIDTLNGGGGDDTLDGNWGNDSMTGGSGNDHYHVDNLGDLVKEVAGQGADKVIATIDYVLAGNVENLDLGSGASKGTGNALANLLKGNAGGNRLDGGAGDDSLVGGAGNDTYVVDSSGDVITESSTLGTEIDSVLAGVNWTLGINLENLMLTGTAAQGTGNALANTLTGNAGANTLSGGAGNDVLKGGAGSDRLMGGTGKDTYVVDSSGDVIRETSTLSTEIDIVKAAVDWTLGSNLENLILTGTAANGTGNALANTLTGNASANVLDGRAGNDLLVGGTGNDSLTGGIGFDTFRFDTAVNATSNLDWIADFSVTDDTIQLENAIFRSLIATGDLSAQNFHASVDGTAMDSDDFILYDTDAGTLAYDTDGSGSASAVPIVLIGTGLALTAGDFLVT